MKCQSSIGRNNILAGCCCDWAKLVRLGADTGVEYAEVEEINDTLSRCLNPYVKPFISQPPTLQRWIDPQGNSEAAERPRRRRGCLSVQCLGAAADQSSAISLGHDIFCLTSTLHPPSSNHHTPKQLSKLGLLLKQTPYRRRTFSLRLKLRIATLPFIIVIVVVNINSRPTPISTNGPADH